MTTSTTNKLAMMFNKSYTEEELAKGKTLVLSILDAWIANAENRMKTFAVKITGSDPYSAFEMHGETAVEYAAQLYVFRHLYRVTTARGPIGAMKEAMERTLHGARNTSSSTSSIRNAAERYQTIAYAAFVDDVQNWDEP